MIIISTRVVPLDLALDQAIQIVEFKNITVLDYENKQRMSDIPLSKSTYQGRALDAPWRSLAQKRIKAIREGTLNLELRDENGHPLQNTTVQIKMRRHHFPFGAALNPWRLLGESEDDKQYQQHVRAYFNAGTFENALKWGAWDEQWGTDKWNKAQTVRAPQMVPAKRNSYSWARHRLAESQTPAQTTQTRA